MRVDNLLGVEGTFYAGEVPGTVCFVPASMVSEGQLDRARYVADGWTSLNIRAQPSEPRLGSHLFPDLKKPVSAAAVGTIRRRLEKLSNHAASAHQISL